MEALQHIFFFQRRNVQGFSMIIFDEFYRFSLFGNIVEIV